MIYTIIFCLCVTGLCCYTTHIVLNEQRKQRQEQIFQTQSDIIKLLIQKDTIAMKKPLKMSVNKFYDYATNTNQHHTESSMAEIIDITPIVNRQNKAHDNSHHDNFYPIYPSKKLSSSKRLDMRA
jgi:hypothetical protein